MIEGKPGAGKSSLALDLIDRGGILVGDDGVLLSVQDEIVYASPPPNIEGKIEIRNVGLVDLPVTSAPLALILKLDADAPRYCEQAARREVLGQMIPTLPFSPGTIAPAQRAEWALRVHGLAFAGDERD